MRVTPRMLEASYELLLATPPFLGWHLPEADDVEFHVTRHKDRCGDHVFDGKRHIIRISAALHGRLIPILQTMAHEMCHVRTSLTAPWERGEHGEHFRRAARSACREHGWDVASF